MKIFVKVGACLEIYPEFINGKSWIEIIDLVREALTIVIPKTPDKEEYRKCLMRVGPSGYRISTPRGFLKPLQEGIIALGHQPVLDNEIFYEDMHLFGTCKYPMRPHQEEAIRAILSSKEGVIVAPPAAGKTVLALEAIRRAGQRSLVIVDKLNLIDQWVERSREFLGVTPNVIASSVGGWINIEVCNWLTIGMQQTLFKIPNLYNNYGFVVLDECHHVSADTYLEVFEKFPALYRIGLSATPYRDDGLELISKLVIGPVIYEIDALELQKRKHILKPEIIRVRTTFSHDFWSTHNVTKEMICDKPGCPKNGKAHSHRNNYQVVTKSLIEDGYRNTVIATHVNRYRDKCNMIVSDRLDHLRDIRNILIKLGFPEERTHMFTGNENSQERAEVVRKAAYGSCAIFSTIAKEALDIPRLDRLHLAWPVKKDHILEQQIGRITRTHPDKSEALVLDYVDEGCSVLANQARERFNYYRQKNYTITEQ